MFARTAGGQSFEVGLPVVGVRHCLVLYSIGMMVTGVCRSLRIVVLIAYIRFFKLLFCWFWYSLLASLFSLTHFCAKGYSSFLRMTLCLIFTTAKLSSISVSEVAVERLLLFASVFYVLEQFHGAGKLPGHGEGVDDGEGGTYCLWRLEYGCKHVKSLLGEGC